MPPPLSSGVGVGLNLLQKGGRTLIFRGGVGKEGADLFEVRGRGCIFHIKSRLKSEIFKDKIFFSDITKNSNWEILNKNLITFKK